MRPSSCFVHVAPPSVVASTTPSWPTAQPCVAVGKYTAVRSELTGTFACCPALPSVGGHDDVAARADGHEALARHGPSPSSRRFAASGDSMAGRSSTSVPAFAAAGVAACCATATADSADSATSTAAVLTIGLLIVSPARVLPRRFRPAVEVESNRGARRLESRAPLGRQRMPAPASASGCQSRAGNGSLLLDAVIEPAEALRRLDASDQVVARLERDHPSPARHRRKRWREDAAVQLAARVVLVRRHGKPAVLVEVEMRLE